MTNIVSLKEVATNLKEDNDYFVTVKFINKDADSVAHSMDSIEDNLNIYDKEYTYRINATELVNLGFPAEIVLDTSKLIGELFILFNNRKEPSLVLVSAISREVPSWNITYRRLPVFGRVLPSKAITSIKDITENHMNRHLLNVAKEKVRNVSYYKAVEDVLNHEQMDKAYADILRSKLKDGSITIKELYETLLG